MRLDEMLLARELADSITVARALVMTGKVLVDDVVVTKPGTRVPEHASVRVRGAARDHASRAGQKLEAALARFEIDVTDRVVLDAGASAGGFTDCLLRHGARRVYAVDVGYGQMDGRLAGDDRVVCLERTNISDLRPETFDAAPELCTVDLSYLSLRKSVPILSKILAPSVPLVCLVKPPYEGLAQHAEADLQQIARVLEELLPALEAASPRSVAGLIPSPILGGRGAVELLLLLSMDEATPISRAIEQSMKEAAALVEATPQ